MMEDSRKSPRCTIHWRCAIVVEAGGKQETIQSKTNDISSTGISIICHRNIYPPQTVTVYLLIDPGSENHPQVIVEAQGEIKNNVLSGQQGGYRLGIQFTKFARDGKQVLQKHLPRELVQSARVVTSTDARPFANMAAAPNAAPAADAAAAQELAPPTEDAPAAESAPAEEGAVPAADAAPAAEAMPATEASGSDAAADGTEGNSA